jgi:hypothetical protein
VFGDSIAQPEQVDPGEQALAGSEQDRRNGEVHLVHQARLQVLPDRSDAAAEPHVLILGCVAGTRERFADAFGDEVKRGAAIHRDGWSRMVCEHEDGRVVWRGVAPPPHPRLIRPRATNRPEHIPPEYPGADACESARDEVVVDARRTAPGAVDLLKGARGEQPVVKRHAADAQRVPEILVGSRPEAVERNAEATDAELSITNP